LDSAARRYSTMERRASVQVPKGNPRTRSSTSRSATTQDTKTFSQKTVRPITSLQTTLLLTSFVSKEFENTGYVRRDLSTEHTWTIRFWPIPQKHSDQPERTPQPNHLSRHRRPGRADDDHSIARVLDLPRKDTITRCKPLVTLCISQAEYRFIESELDGVFFFDAWVDVWLGGWTVAYVWEWGPFVYL